MTRQRPISPATASASGSTRAVDPRVIVAFGLVYIIWGSTYMAIRVAVESVPPAASAAVRFLSAGTLMLLLGRLSGRTIVVPRRELLPIMLIGLLLLVCGNGLVVWSEQFVPSGMAALMVAVLPLWIAIIEALLPNGERLPAVGWFGVLLGFAGLVVLLWPKLAGGLTGELRGQGAVMLASLCWAVGSLYSKRVTFTVSPFVVTGWEMLIGGSLLAMIAAVSGEFKHFAPTRDGWLALAYLTTFGSCVAFSAFVWLLQHVPAAKVATYAYVNPVIAVLLGWLLLGEAFTPSMVLGTPIIVGAVALVTTAKIRSTGAAPEPLDRATVPALVTEQRQTG